MAVPERAHGLQAFLKAADRIRPAPLIGIDAADVAEGVGFTVPVTQFTRDRQILLIAVDRVVPVTLAVVDEPEVVEGLRLAVAVPELALDLQALLTSRRNCSG